MSADGTGIDAKAVGERIEVRNNIVSFYEVGDHQPSLDIIIKVARTFEVPADYLLAISNNCGGISIEGLTDDEIVVLAQTEELMRRKKL